MNILQDIRTAAAVFGDIRKERKKGISRKRVKLVDTVPIFALHPVPLDTMEGTVLLNVSRDLYQAWAATFAALPHETQRRLESTPKKPGEWAERARLWKRELKSVLPPKMYHEVMISFIHWYARCIRSTHQT